MSAESDAFEISEDVVRMRIAASSVSLDSRKRLARSPSTPEDVRTTLASDPSVAVRRLVAKWDGLEPAAITALLTAVDPTHETVANLLQSRDLPANVVRELYRRIVVGHEFPTLYERAFSTYLFTKQVHITDDVLGALVEAFPDDDDFVHRAVLHQNSAILTYTAAATHGNTQLRTMLARYDLPPTLFARLAVDSDAEVRRQVFESVHAPWSAVVSAATTPEMVARLPFHPAHPENTLPRLQAVLAFQSTAAPKHSPSQATDDEIDPRVNSAEEDVRNFLAATSTSSATLRVLASDKSALVRNTLSMNDRTPADAVERIGAGPLSEGVDPTGMDWMSVANVAIHPNASIPLLIRLAQEGDAQIQLNVASNDNAPQALLEYLRFHPDPEVRDAAEATIARR